MSETATERQDPLFLSHFTTALLENLKQIKPRLRPDDLSKINVSQAVSLFALVYERIRNAIEYREDHLIRRAAIERILKRRLMLNPEGRGEAENIIRELLWARYFSNGSLGGHDLITIQEIIDKYISIKRSLIAGRPIEVQQYLAEFLIQMLTCEIEETLAPAVREMALIDYMFSAMKEKIRVSDKIYESGLLKKDLTYVQIYIAVCQALFKLDKSIISYHLIKYRYPEWDKGGQQLILEISQKIFKIWQKTEEDLANPVANKFYNICEKYDTPYLLMGDILSASNGAETGKQISEPSVLENYIKEAYSKRMSTLKARISRAAVYSTISIFATKVLSLVLLEAIIEEVIGSKLNALALSADVLIPTALMFVMVSLIKRPSRKNINIVIIETMKIAYKKETGDTYEIKMRKKRGATMKTILSLIYVFSAFITFGTIFLILKGLGFPITSILIDIIFIALILFAGTAVSKRAQELTMEDEKEGFFSFVSDVFFLPMHGLGQWISNKWKRYNALAAFFNALIDMPFSAFVEFIEKWRYFIKERKEEMR